MTKRPNWITLQDEISIRKTATDIGKLQAVKDVMELTKTAGMWGNSTDGKGQLLPHSRNYVSGTPAFGLKESKDYVESLEKWKEPLDELKNVFDTLREAKRSLPDVLRTAFPDLSEANFQRAMEDEAFLENLIKKGNASAKFGV
jgi:hypothetical protein